MVAGVSLEMTDRQVVRTTTSSLSLGEDAVLVLARHMAVEYFDSGALVLDLRSRTLTELDGRQSWILGRLNGQRTVAQVSEEYAAASAVTYDQADTMVRTACQQLLKAHCLRLVRGSWKGDTVDVAQYIQNPDVNLREEDEDGALLFNPDTDRVQLLNTTGLYIWKLCTEGRAITDIVAAFKADFDEVPEDEVAADVEEFINQMVDSGFVGTVQNP
jgi:hypothetical protein